MHSIRNEIVLFLIVFIFVSQIDGQCPSDFMLTRNNETYFTVSANKTCSCEKYSGDGSQLSGLENQPTVANLISETQTVSLKAAGNNGQVFPVSQWSTVVYNQPIKDTHNGYDSAKYTVPLSGDYYIQFSTYVNMGASTGYKIDCTLDVAPCGANTGAHLFARSYNGVSSSIASDLTITCATSAALGAGTNLYFCIYPSSANLYELSNSWYKQISINRIGS